VVKSSTARASEWATLLIPPMNASAQPDRTFDHIVVLGDSLSDMGNAGRFSNGPVWVERLAANLKIDLGRSQSGGTNFAIGGAKLDSRSDPSGLRAQADLFLKIPRRSGRTLHVVFGGGNDVIDAIGQPDAPGAIKQAVESLRSIVTDLLARGATDLLVPNLPDVGMTPEVRGRGSGAVEEAGRLSRLFNEAADGAFEQLAGAVGPGRKLYRLDIHAMAERARQDPAGFGFVDVTTPCNVLRSCDGYLFWDGFHPTTQAHARLADAAVQALSQR
jgi:cholinesterase